MDTDVDLYLAVRLLFTILALILTSVFLKLWGTEEEWPQEPLVSRGSCPGDQEARKEAVEEPSPKAEPSPVVTESIPWQLPAEPREPKPQEDAGDHAALPRKAEEDLDSNKEEQVVTEPSSTAATPAPVTSTATSFRSSEGFEWPLGTLET
ncbi:hypothetical protein AAES_02480 [Amazona aestiva]|uniref:Matrix-remodeling-associated protein 7 n=1 Tax=Amazona aestiva TaxID=12930 RepID=A0A0Q3U4W7_AMAAE|nr:hypothetical protein AAES_02480 [Amazona aestiva]